ncbi:MAG: hypothetical protein GY719_10695, partial [bacterium]|nr:hypothetical protein [bacterium]
HVNLTGNLTSAAGNSGTATDTLVVNQLPSFAKAFSPGTIATNATSTLTFTIDNTASTIAASALDFNDNLPADATVAAVPNASTTCTGGTLTATAGTGVISYTGGTVVAGATCTVQADVTSTTTGSHVNLTGDLTSSAGNSGTATDTLNVIEPPVFSKAFAPDAIYSGQISTLTFTIDSTANTVAVGNLAFTDNLPTGVVVAATPNASTTCTGGTITAPAAGTAITYAGGTVGAGATCTLSVDATSSTPDAYVNVADDLTSDAGATLGPPVVEWAVRMGGTIDRDEAAAIAVDPAGNSYTTGQYRGTADFDPGPGTFNLSASGTNAAFVVKLDPAGALAWAVELDGVEREDSFDVAADAAGNVYVTGEFQGTVDFDPGPGTFNLSSMGVQDIFVVKLDTLGNLVWARAMGSSNQDRGTGIAVDGGGNVYTTGLFFGTVDFDPGPGSLNLTSAGQTDIFVQKLDPAGNLAWALRMGGSDFDDGSGIEIDGAGNVVSIGTFTGPVDFDPGPGTFNVTGLGGYLHKLDAAGNFILAVATGGFNYSIAVDAAGNSHLIGYYGGTVDFDPGPGTFNLTSAGSSEIFFQKLDAGGNLLWVGTAVNAASSPFDSGIEIAVDASGNALATGVFNGTVDFDPGSGTANLTSLGDDEIFLLGLGSGGNLGWAFREGSTGGDAGRGMAVGPAGAIWVSGSFEGTVDFDFGPGSSNLTSAGGADIFIQKLGPGGAIDTLVVNPQPGFAKAFAPDTIATGTTSTLTFTIDNSASTIAASALDFTDNLPAGVVVAGTPSASTTCTGGTITANAGAGTIGYTGGTVAAGATCTVQTDVTSATTGSHVNTTGDLTSSAGNSGTAGDTLHVIEPPAFSKTFSPAAIYAGQTSTLTFTIDSTANTVAVGSLAFTDNLPAGVTVAATPAASTTC